MDTRSVLPVEPPAVHVVPATIADVVVYALVVDPFAIATTLATLSLITTVGVDV